MRLPDFSVTISRIVKRNYQINLVHLPDYLREISRYYISAKIFDATTKLFL
jgi:hypothetical protein